MLEEEVSEGEGILEFEGIWSIQKLRLSIKSKEYIIERYIYFKKTPMTVRSFNSR